MMHGAEKSDPVIVAGKPANKAEQPPAERSAGEPNAAELVEPRAGTKGNAGQQSRCRTQSRASLSQELERIRQVAAAGALSILRLWWRTKLCRRSQNMRGRSVAYRSHRGPGNVGVGCFKFLGEMPNGLAHDIVGPHHRITRPFVGQIGLQRHPFNKSDQGATSADDISQKIAIIALSNHKWTASSSTRRPIYGFNASRATRSTLRSTNADSASSSARNSERARGALEFHQHIEITFRARGAALPSRRSRGT